ncbi:MAG: CinA family protein [Candidatus Omnitrophica bacterium]|nr:CinA family protein [Candidatus Omnitrophota bacterium]
MFLDRKVAEILIDTKKTLSLAESCTGGLVTNLLTNISGSSAFLKCSIIAYSNEAKIKILKVPVKIIKKHGAVSEETATIMAQNVRNLFKTDFGLAITGIAGPTGGTKTKPVGLTFIALSMDYGTLCLKCKFKGSRLEIKKQAAKQALVLLKEFL